MAINQLINKISKIILDITPQLYYIKDASTKIIKVLPLGSGIFYRNEDNFYLITASHIYESKDDDGKCIKENQIGLMINDTFYILIDTLYQTTTSKSTINKNIDLAILVLDKNIITDIQEKYSFLENTHILFKHTPSNQSKYLMVGFPVTQTKYKIHTKKIIVKPFIFLNKLNIHNKYTSNTNIVFNVGKFGRFFGNNLRAQTPKLYGVSGSGLWFINHLSDKYYLIGIMTEWHEDDQLSLGTKIDIAIDIIYKIQFATSQTNKSIQETSQ